MASALVLLNGAEAHFKDEEDVLVDMIGSTRLWEE